MAAAAVVLLGGGDEPARLGDAEANRERIEQMTQAERERLKRKFDDYRKLSPAQREVYRELHRAIEDDAAQGGDLKDVLHAYAEWLTTLSPWQRERLRTTDDPQKRLELVKEFMEEQKQRDEYQRLSREQQEMLAREKDPEAHRRLLEKFRAEQWRRPPRGGHWPREGSDGGFSGRDIRLDPAELDAVLQIVEERVSLSEADRRAVSGEPQHVEHLYLLHAALEQLLQARREKQPAGWLDGETVGRIILKLADEADRKQLLSISDEEQRRKDVLRIILRSFLSEWSKATRPSEEELRKFFASLSDEKRDKLMHRRGRHQKFWLEREYRIRHPGPHREKFVEYWRAAGKLLHPHGHRRGSERRDDRRGGRGGR